MPNTRSQARNTFTERYISVLKCIFFAYIGNLFAISLILFSFSLYSFCVMVLLPHFILPSMRVSGG